MENTTLVPVFNPPSVGGYIENQNKYRYRVARALRSGNFGTIYLGYDIFEVPYAIKVFKPSGTYEEVRIMWQEEAGKLRELSHPHIAYMHDVFEYKFAFYIVMEWLGKPLSEYVKGSPMLSDEQIIDITRQILFGMSFIHWHNIIHRDLSLDNVLFTRDESLVKITDFGVSKFFEPFAEKQSHEPPFKKSIICPDLLRFGFSTPQSDLYHLGLILLSLKMGKPPIDPNLPEEEINKQCLDGIPRKIAESLSCPLGEKISVLLRRRAEHRYPSAMHVWNDLRVLVKNRKFD
ncbi:MAG: serine/threonine-protein kinase [Atribacterota bacterium]|nr:serine/threonine-protein kinase [Atribacterota bacterium]